MPVRRCLLAGRGDLAVVWCAGAALLVPLAPAQATEALGGAQRDVSVTASPASPDKQPQGVALDRVPSSSVTRVPDEVLVRFAPGVSAADRGAIRSTVGGSLERRLPLRGLELLQVGNGAGQAVAALERRPEVLYAEPNFIYAVTDAPNDPQLPQLWGLHNTGQVVADQAGTVDADIDAPEAWDNATGDGAVSVAVVDTGIAYDHVDLAPNAWMNPGETSNGLDDDLNGYVDDVRGWDWAADDNDPRDPNGHGTHVAGTIGASGNDGVGITGVAWDVSLMPLRVLGADGSGTVADIVAGFAYAAAQGADVVNASLGGPAYSQSMSDVIASSPQTLFVVAAGNSAEDTGLRPTYPCSYPASNLLCVAATDNQDRLAAFSNYGTESVDLAAPGIGIVSTMPPLAKVLDDGFAGAWNERWSTGGTRAWGTESSSTRGQFLSDSPGTSYASYANTWVRPRAAVDLSGMTDCSLEYLLALDTEQGYDGLLVEAAPSGGTWQRVAAWTGSSGGWVHLRDSLANFDGVSALHLRFRLTSDDIFQRSGAWIDDVGVTCLGSTDSQAMYASLDGTSMASPHVSGAAALLLAAAPGTDVSTLRDALLGGVDTSPSLVNVTATGGRLNVSNSLDRLVDMVRFSDASPAVAEDAPAATVQVQRTGDLDSPATVAYQTSTGTAAPGSDYSPTEGILSFEAGQSTASFSVPLRNDDVFEGDEIVGLVLSSPTGTPLGSPSTSTLTIRDDDLPAVVSFAHPAGTVAEDTGVVGLILSRTGNLDAPATVEYSPGSGSATSGSDYSLTPQTLTFAPGQTTASIMMPIINDSAPEADETLAVSLLSRRADTTIAPAGSTLSLTIAASDQQPDAQISTARTSGFTGNDVYNGTGDKQTRTISARRGQTRSFYVRVYNDGNATNTVAIQGSAARSGSAVKYFAADTDITQAMRSPAGWGARLAPGRYALVTAQVKILSRAPIGSLKSAMVSGTWTGDGTRTDTSRAVVKVTR